MAKKETPASDTPIPVQGSVAPAGYRTQAPAGVAQRVASSSQPALKGNTASRLSAEQNPDFQAMMAKILEGTGSEDPQFKRFMQLALINQNFASDHTETLSYAQIIQKPELSASDVLRADTSDNKVTSTPVIEEVKPDGSRVYHTGSGIESLIQSRPDLSSLYSNPADRMSKPSVAATGKPDGFRLTSIGDIQRELVDVVQYAARVTGVPAQLLGAMAGKESGFGKNQKSHSGAEGIWQQTDGYLISNYMKNPAQARFIAQHVPEAAEYLKDGKISLAEAQKLAWNPLAAAIMTGLRAKDFAQDYKLDINKPSSWALVYTEHNAGRGSVDKLLSGGMTDKWIRDLNPSMYRGASTAQDVIAIAARDMEVWGNRFDRLAAQIGGTETLVAVAPNRQNRLPAPAPEPA